MPIYLSAVEGNRQKLDGGAMFGNAPRPMWEKWHRPDAIGRIELACRALLVEVGDQKILCETGIGAFFEPKLAERFGVQDPETHHLLLSLKKLGIEEKDISAVILSHLHFDHAGGLLPAYADLEAGNKDLLFPNAQYIVGQEAWERNQHPHIRDRASFIPHLADKLIHSQRLLIIPSGASSAAQKLPTCISFFYSFGHTPGHMHTLIRGQKETALFCGDLIPGTTWLHAPLTMGYDRFPEHLIDEKLELYNKAIPEHWFLFYTHDPVYPASYGRWDENKRVLADQALTSLIRMPLH